MKILIIIDSLGSGGAERSTAVICKYLQTQNIYFNILCLDKKDVGVQQEMLEEGHSIHFVEKKGFLSEVREIQHFVKMGKFDLVHSILFRANIRTRFARIFTNFFHLESLVNTTYSDERLADNRVNQKALKFYKYLDEKTASRAVDHFHSITQTVKQHYIEEIHLKPEKITVIPRGRKPLINSYDERPGSCGGTFKLVNVGRHEFQKGQIYLLKAIKILKEKGYDIHLTILGRNGSTTSSLKDYVNTYHLDKIVSFEGFKDDVADYLLKSDLFVFPSLFEGLGGALIEAQAAGLPVACNDIPVLHEVVTQDAQAKFFNVHDLDSLVDAIAFFTDNPGMCETYGKRSLENFKTNFRESVSNEKMLNLYVKLCSNTGK